MDGDVVIDLRHMRQIVVKGDQAIVGATSLDVAEEANRFGLAPVTGNLGPVGIAGLTLGGGYGPLTGLAGLASDTCSLRK